MSDHLLEAVERVSVHQLANVRARTLVLHTRLHQIDRVDERGAGRAGNRAQTESVHGLHELDGDASLLRTVHRFHFGERLGQVANRPERRDLFDIMQRHSAVRMQEIGQIEQNVNLQRSYLTHLEEAKSKTLISDAQ